MKKILIYAHYYYPDVASTGQILQELAEGISDEFDVTVICTIPSYTGRIQGSYREKKLYHEVINGVKVLRVPVPEFHKGSKISRIKNLLTYFFQARKATKIVGNQDYVFTISQPPIMGGMLGVYGKSKVCGKLIYCVQDFNPEQIEATGYFSNGFIIGVMRWLDKRNCRKSDLVITVGRDLVETLKLRFANEIIPNYTMINNWINEKSIYPLPSDNPNVIKFKEKYGLIGKFVIMYSGNIGLYYDLEGIIKVIEKFKGAQTSDGQDVVFAFVGSGSILNKLENYAQEKKMNNVVFIPYQDKENLIYSLNAADVHWCVNAQGIKGVSCPSKFYGIAGVAKPVLGVLERDSEIEILIREIGCGKCSEPRDYEDIENNIRWFIDMGNKDKMLQMGNKGHDYLIAHLSKEKSINKYKEAIKDL